MHFSSERTIEILPAKLASLLRLLALVSARASDLAEGRVAVGEYPNADRFYLPLNIIGAAYAQDTFQYGLGSPRRMPRESPIISTNCALTSALALQRHRSSRKYGRYRGLKPTCAYRAQLVVRDLHIDSLLWDFGATRHVRRLAIPVKGRKRCQRVHAKGHPKMAYA